LLATTVMPAIACAQSVPGEDQAVDNNEIVVTAAGYEQRIAEAPASISILTRDELETRPFTSLGDAVRNVEGVSVVGDAPNTTDIVIRGMPGEYTLIMLDGRRQTTRETMNRGTGGVQANLIPPLAAIERIEVVRGPTSSLYGSDAMGGVVTLGGIAQEDGRYGNTTLGNFWVGAPLASDTVGIQVYGGFNDRGEDRIAYPSPGPGAAGSNGIRNRNINGKISYLFAPGQDLTLEGGYNYLAYIETPGKSATAANTIIERHRRNYQALTWNGDFSGTKARLSAYREQEKFVVETNGVASTEPNLVNWTIDGMVTVPMGTWNTLNVGGQYIHTKVTGIAGQDSVPLHPNTDSVTRQSWSLFAEDHLRPIDGLIITGGVRLDHSDQFGSHFTPRVYVNYTLTPGLTLRGGIARGFKAPTIRQSASNYCMSTGGATPNLRGVLCGNPDLKPEISTTKEIGLRYDGAGKLGFGVTLFHTNFKNKIVSFPDGGIDPPTGLLTYIYDNLDRVVIKGVEVNATVPVTPALLLTANYTYTDSKRKGGSETAFDGSSLDGMPLDKTPTHMANVRLDWRITDQISAYGQAYYTGEQYWSGFRNGSTKTRTREASTTFDLGVNFVVNKNFTLRAAVLNLTDKIVPLDLRGRTTGLDGNWMVDEGRRFWGTATISF